MFSLPPSPSYLVAFSGGPDSRCLLEQTIAYAAAAGSQVYAAHVHHGIRGPEADRDERFCREVCAARGVRLFVGRLDVPALAARGRQSVELAAREARYAFLTRVMLRYDIPVLLTAHHADDTLETVLFRLLRGSGVRGLGGIPESRPLGRSLRDGTPCVVYRPLLFWTRREILRFLEERALPFVSDSTNLADDCARNRLRHTVVPALEAIAGPDRPQRAAARLAKAAREDDEALSAIARAAFARAADEGTGSIDLSRTVDEPPAVMKRLLSLAYAAFLRGARPEGPAARALPAARLEELLALCAEGRDGDVSSLLPSDVRAERHGGALVFTLPTDPPDPHPLRRLPAGVSLWDGGSAGTPPVWVEIEELEAPCAPKTGRTVFASAVLPADSLPLPLAARERAEGDVILSHGLRKRLRKILIDRRVPAAWRGRLPLFCLPDGQTPLWYPGAAFRDGYAAPDRGPCLRVTVRVGDDVPLSL